MSEHDDETYLGAYVLGQLSGPDVARVEAHLGTCARCRAARDELLGPAAALAVLRDGGDRVGPDAPPAELELRILGGLDLARRRETRRRRLQAGSLAAVAGAAAAAVVVTVALLTGSDDPAPQARIPLERVPVVVEERGIAASADVVAHTWGVEVKLTASGFARGDRYRVAVVDVDGGRHPAGEFVGTGSAEMLCNLNSSVLRGRAEGFEVRDGGGDVVVVSHFPR